MERTTAWPTFSGDLACAALLHLGRLGHEADCDALARLLTGAALHEAFLASYAGEKVRDPQALARRLVGALALPT